MDGDGTTTTTTKQNQQTKKRDPKIRRSCEINGDIESDKEYWITRSGPRSHLYAAGYKDDDFHKPTVTISGGYMSHIMCNQKVGSLVKAVGSAIEDLGNASICELIKDVLASQKDALKALLEVQLSVA